jgi:cation:H+ antiporter
MIAQHAGIFVVALFVLLMAARFFTKSAEEIGHYLKLPGFVIGVFIIGIGTSLPELISGIFAVNMGTSEILPGNVMGATISNLLLVTGFSVLMNRKRVELKSKNIQVDLHFLIGSIFIFSIISLDGKITWIEGLFSLALYFVYSFHLFGSEDQTTVKPENQPSLIKAFILLAIGSVGIYFGAEYTIKSLTTLSVELGIPSEIVALTVLSLGTTLPELAVNAMAVKAGKIEMAIGSILGSCVFNTSIIPGVASFYGEIQVPSTLLHFSLPMMGGSALFFYLLSKDKRISQFEGILFILLYVLFVIKIVGL